jgi:hypothetical protein
MSQSNKRDEKVSEIQLISSNVFREAAAAGALSAPAIVGVDGGYVLEATFGEIRKQLSARSATGNQKRRIFTSFQSAADFLIKAKIMEFAVDAREHTPAPSAPRYKRVAERLRQAHAAARTVDQ